MNSEHLLLRTVRGEDVERPPVWLMRQAGRILPEYRAVRNKLRDFRELVETPELAAEVTVQPVDILGVDAAIIFSDILVVPDVMGLPYRMEKGKGPVFDETIVSRRQIEELHGAPAAEDLDYVYEAIEKTIKELDGRVPLIGFCGAPWTLMAYMIEGSGSKTFSKARRFLYQEPQLAHALLQKITEVLVRYLKIQIKSGAQVVQVFDSWAGVLGAELYREFGLRYIGMICDEVEEAPKTVFAKDAHFVMDDLLNLNCETIGLDWTVDVTSTRKKVANRKCLQGNLDPCVLYANDERIGEETKKMLSNFGNKLHIANLGHGVYPDTDPEKVKTFINTVKAYKY